MRYHQEYDQPPTAFSAWLTDLLQRQRLSEWRLARKLGIDIHTVMQWRKGILPKPATCVKLADLFHVPLAEVYALAAIPLRATHELVHEDWYGVPDITLTPEARLLAMLPLLGLSPLQQQSIIASLSRTKKERTS